MPLPANVNVVRVRGYWHNQSGGGHNGTITFTPVAANLTDTAAFAWIKTATVVVTADPVTAYFYADLIATDDPDLTPFAWRVTFKGQAPFTIAVPHDAPLVDVGGGVMRQAIWLSAAAPTPAPPTPAASYYTTVQTDAAIGAAVTTHSADATGVHGIPDTTLLETTAGAAAKVTTHTGAADPHGDRAAAAAALAAHEADTTSIHGIPDTAALETQSGAAAKVSTHVAAVDPHGDRAYAAAQDAAHAAAADPHPGYLTAAEGDTRYPVLIAPPTGVAATDTAVVQAALDAAAAAGVGVVRLASGGNYVVNGITIDTGVTLDLNGGGLTLAPGANTHLVATKDYATLVGGNSTSGPTDWGIINGHLDGNKTNQTATDKPVLAIYGRRYVLDNLMIRNGKGAGIHSQWSTVSPFVGPNGFEAFVTRVYVHHCDGDGIRFEGPHDSYFHNFFIVACAASSSTVPLYVTSGGRANGSNFDKFHIYGGGGYQHGLVVAEAGLKFTNFVVEGAQVGQVLIQAAQVQLDAAHVYTGGIQTATAKGILVGDATHTGINGCTIRAKIENCGGGGLDFTYMGDHNIVDCHVFYYTGTAPTLASLGFTGTPTKLNRVLLYVAGNDFLPTVHNLNQQVGPAKLIRVATADTRDLVDVRDDTGNTTMYSIDYRGRPRSKAGSTPTVANGAQIGSGGAPATSISGTDHAGTVTITTGSTGAAAGQLAAASFNASFTAAPRAVVLMPKDAASAALQPFVTTGPTGFSVRCAATPAASTTYAFDYIVIGS